MSGDRTPGSSNRPGRKRIYTSVTERQEAKRRQNRESYRRKKGQININFRQVQTSIPGEDSFYIEPSFLNPEPEQPTPLTVLEAGLEDANETALISVNF